MQRPRLPEMYSTLMFFLKIVADKNVIFWAKRSPGMGVVGLYEPETSTVKSVIKQFAWSYIGKLFTASKCPLLRKYSSLKSASISCTWANKGKPMMNKNDLHL